MTRLGVNLPLPGLPLREHGAVVEQLIELGYEDVWTGEALAADAITPLAAAAAREPRLRVGTGVLPVYTRGPALLAQTAMTLAELADGGVLLGVGASVPEYVGDANGLEFSQPLARVRDTVRFLKRALAGERVSGAFDTFEVRHFALERPVAAKVLVGALRPRMLQVGFDDADGVVTNLLLAEDLPRVAGRAKAGSELVMKVFVCPAADRAWARRRGREFVTFMLNLASYRAFHDWLGRGARLADMHERWAAGDVEGARAALPEDILDGLWITGTPDECRAQIERFLQPGVTALNLFVAPTPEPQSVTELLAALRPSP